MRLIVISYPKKFRQEIELVIRLFEEGMQYFHLRKPNWGRSEICEYIEKIPEKFRHRIILYNYFDLVEKYHLKGMHFNKHSLDKLPEYKDSTFHKSISTHSFEEIKSLECDFDYALLSPVFNSISKSGYMSRFKPADIKLFTELYGKTTPIVGLGGVSATNVEKAINMGLDGVAILGAVWDTFLRNNNIEIAVDVFKQIRDKCNKNRPFVMTIAGHDPSAGAGILADIKTMEMGKVYGLGVCSAITEQNESSFQKVDWLEKERIIGQIDVLIEKYDIGYMKIGLIENVHVLSDIVDYLLEKKPRIKIIWDPIIRSSTGFVFMQKIDREKIFAILKKIYLLTPNLEEAKSITDQSENIVDVFSELVSNNGICSVLLKGGHGDGDSIKDVLITKNGIEVFSGDRYVDNGKHGTGCVLAAAITTGLARGKELKSACLDSKKYVEKFMLSTISLLGYHS